MGAIKLFLISGAVENGGAFSGVVQMLWAFIEKLGELFKYIPDIIATLPWWLTEILLILVIAFGLPLLLRLIDYIKEKWAQKKERLTKGNFEL